MNADKQGDGERLKAVKGILTTLQGKSVFDDFFLHQSQVRLFYVDPYKSYKYCANSKRQNANKFVINLLAFFFVLEAGLEPAQPQWPRDFKSLVSTDSTIRASFQRRAENETRTRDPNLGKVMLYQLSYFRIFNGCKDRSFYYSRKIFYQKYTVNLSISNG